jgi:cytochrome c nitrite reductase small subunit
MSRKWIALPGVLAGLALLGGVGAVGLWEYRKQPPFCAECHIIQPYLESWQGSDLEARDHAAEGVACLDCHEATLDDVRDDLTAYLQGGFSVPLEELKYPTEDCLGCHLENEHTSYEEVIQRTQDYVIDGRMINPHAPHVGVEGVESEYECYNCHKMHRESTGLDFCYDCHQALVRRLQPMPSRVSSVRGAVLRGGDR